MPNHCQLMLRISLVLAFVGAAAGERVKHRLSSADELKGKYLSYLSAESKSGLLCFFGKRKDLNPKYQTKDQLYVFDKKSLEVWPLQSEAITGCLKGNWGFHGLQFDQSGTKIAAVPVFRTTGTWVISYRIVVIDLNSLEAETVVADGDVNYAPSFSPDGRYLAYFSTEHRTDISSFQETPRRENAGRIVNLETKQITTVTDHFVLPKGGHLTDTGLYTYPPTVWLDNERVLFGTFATDREFIAQHVSDFTGDKCGHWAVGNARTGQIKRLLTPGGYGGTAIDFDKKRIFLSDLTKILETDFDLSVLRQVATAGEGKRIIVTGVEDGDVTYRIRERPKPRN